MSGQQKEEYPTLPKDIQEWFENGDFTKEELKQSLLEACRHGARNVVEFLLSAGVTLDIKDDEERALVIVSAMNGHEDIIALLLDRDGKAASRNMDSAVIEACKKGYWRVVEMLVEQGVNVNGRDDDWKTPLMWACSCDYCGHKVVEVLLKHLSVCDVNASDKNGTTAFMVACKSGVQEVLQVLENHLLMFDLKAKDNQGMTALMMACRYHACEDTVNMLMKHLPVLDLNAKDNGGMSAFMWACKNGNKKVVDILIHHVSDLNEKNEDGTSPLMLACRSENEELVKMLLDHGSDVSGRNNQGITPLMEVCRCGWDTMARILIERFSDPKDEVDTALMLAYKKRHVENLKRLMKHKLLCDMKPRDDKGKTDLMQISMRGNETLAEVLLPHVSDPNKTNKEGRTALMYACRRGHDQVIKLLIKHGACVNMRDTKGVTPLIFACFGGHVSTVELLLGQGVDINGRNDSGKTPLMVACQSGQKGKPCEEEYVKVIKLLLQHGANVDAQSVERGWTAAMMAVRNNNVKCLRALLQAKACLDLVDNEGKTVFGYAMEKSNADYTKVLIEEGNLLTDGRLRSVHRDLSFHKPLAQESLLMTIRLGVFEWEWCPLYYFKVVAPIAMSSGVSPGSIELDTGTYLSPLIVSILLNYKRLTEAILDSLYYYPEDYRILCSDMNIRNQIENSDFLDRITHQPMSLQTWCYLTASKAISTSCFPVSRRERVDTLSIPDTFKRRLKFE